MRGTPVLSGFSPDSSSGRHQAITQLADHISHRAFAAREAKIDRAIPAAEIPDLFWMSVIEIIPMQL